MFKKHGFVDVFCGRVHSGDISMSKTLLALVGLVALGWVAMTYLYENPKREMGKWLEQGCEVTGICEVTSS